VVADEMAGLSYINMTDLPICYLTSLEIPSLLNPSLEADWSLPKLYSTTFFS